MVVEMTKISCGRVRRTVGIDRVVLPGGWDPDKIYDKWGNVVLTLPHGATPDEGDKDADSLYSRCPGPMFALPNVQKIMRQGDMMRVFVLPIEEDYEQSAVDDEG
jgi:hypothetical protein